MKKLVPLIIVLLVCANCAGQRYASLNENENSISHVGQNISILNPDASARELAHAKLTLAEAKLVTSMANSIESQANTGQASSTSTAGVNQGQAEKKFVGAIINNDPMFNLYFRHPDFHWVITVKPNKSYIIQAGEIPTYIHARFGNEEYYRAFRIYKSDKTYNGVKIDFGARIQR